MHFKGSGDEESPAERKASRLAPMTEWRLPAPGTPVESIAPPPAIMRTRLWISLGISALVVIVAMVVAINQPDVGDVIDATPVSERTAPLPKVNAVQTSFAPVSLPGGLTIDRSSVMNYDLAAWLAGTPNETRTFTFDHVGFAPGSSAIRASDRSTLQVLSQIIAAYHEVRVTIIGNGPDALGQERAAAIRDALLVLATDPGQVQIRAGSSAEMAPRLEVRIEASVDNGLDA